jgi:hypothetical protein
MPIGINGSGSITGISAGGLPDACITPADLSQPLTLGTAQASTSGTSIDFTGIPSWVKRVTVMFNGVSTNGTSDVQVQIGAGSFTTTGYNSTSTSLGAGVGTISALGGFVLYVNLASNTNSGHMFLTLISGNTWVASSVFKNSTINTCIGGGDLTLSGTLDRIRITTVNGTDTFDAGSINILYE